MKALFAVVIVLAMAGLAQATRTNSVQPSGKEVVVHNRLAPVVVHRVLPPYGLGKHVYQGRTR
jgi:hypothetical protein